MKRKIFFAVCLLFGLLFIHAGLNKFFNYMPVPEDIPEAAMRMFTAMTQISWLMPLLATAEIAGGIAVIIPRLRALGALILAPIIAGIMLTHLTVAPEGLPLALAVLAAYLWIVFENRARFLLLIR